MNNDQTAAIATGQAPTIAPQMPGIDMAQLLQEHRKSKEYVERHTKGFKQLDEIVDGLPIITDEGSPYVADTTLPGLVRQMSRESLQQLPVFSAIVNGTKNNLIAQLCSFWLRDIIFNEQTFGKGLLSTLQLACEQAFTRGYAPLMVAIGELFDEFGTTMKLLHYSDTAPEQGIQDHNETGFDYVEAHLTPSRVRRILNRAKRDPNTNWNVVELQKLLDTPPTATSYTRYESSAEKVAAEQDGDTYDFVTRYETGKDATVITFCSQQGDGDQPLRIMMGRSQWGYPRVMYLVIDPAALTPFGKSRVKLASPNANLMNIYYGHIAAMLLLNSKPPILKRGRFLKPLQLKQGEVWETNDQTAKAELVNIDNGALQSFVPMAQQFASQIRNIMGMPASDISGANNSSGMSKTAPGVEDARDKMSASTNQITKILENTLRQYALVGLDVLLSEQEGEDDIIVDDEAKEAINAITPGTIGEDNIVHVVWADIYGAIKKWAVEVTVSVSKDQLDAKKRGDLQDMLVVLAQNAKDNPEAAQKVTEITNMLLQKEAPLVKPLDPAPAPQQLPPGPTTTPTTPPVAQS